MSGRIVLREGEVADEEVDALVDPGGSAADEEGVRSALRSGFQRARERGSRTIAVAVPGGGSPGPSLQRRAEILIEEARAHLAGDTCLEEVRFVLRGEPIYRLFEAALDAAKVREQMQRLRERQGPRS